MNERNGEAKRLALLEAVNLALHRAMAEDETVVVLGEDVGVNGGVFRATLGLRERFGFKRVLDTPLAENMIAGLSIGVEDMDKSTGRLNLVRADLPVGHRDHVLGAAG